MNAAPQASAPAEAPAASAQGADASSAQPAAAARADAAAEASAAQPTSAEGESTSAATASAAQSASADEDDSFDDAYSAELDVGLADPWQRFNHAMFRVDRGLDRWLLHPLERGYSWLMPDPLERALRRAFDNLDEPAIVVNDTLQAEWRRAGRAFGRFLMNSTVGLAGLTDPARRVGLTHQDADFGQTLGKAGVASGPYLYLPVLGPTNPRDLLGYAVDSNLHAETWVLPLRGWLPLTAADVITLKAAYREELESLERSSIDYYAALRAASTARRSALLKNGTCPAPQPSPARER